MQRVQIALGKLRRSRSNKGTSEDATASAKTGADGLEAWKEVVAAGWLVKTGGKGHTVKNSKKRWFVLRGVFLSYYTEDPSKSVYKDREILSTHTISFFYAFVVSIAHNIGRGTIVSRWKPDLGPYRCRGQGASVFQNHQPLWKGICHHCSKGR
jgi:hypothetical protein